MEARGFVRWGTILLGFRLAGSLAEDIRALPFMTPTSQPTVSRLMKCRDRQILIGDEPLMVGILNITPDSFFDGGKFAAPEMALRQAERLLAEGAAMIDVGGQSTRPGHQEISEGEEIARVVPVIELLSRLPVPLSIDTYKPAVARAALAAGAHLVNDVHGLQRTPEMALVVAEFDSAVIVMHQEAEFEKKAGDTIESIRAFFQRSLEIATRAGIPADRIILDPGIGFTKTSPQNLEILARLGELRSLGCPLLLGASRKSVISHVLALPPEDRLEGTLAITALAVWQGVEFFRVHDVRDNLRAAKVARAIRRFSAV